MTQGLPEPPLPPEGSAPGEPPAATPEPWIETPSGSRFFLNAILVAPAALVLLPLLFSALFRVLGVARLSALLSVIPQVADLFVPWVGWIAVVPLATTASNLRMEERPVPRALLLSFLLTHAAVLTYTVWRWLGGGAL